LEGLRAVPPHPWADESPPEHRGELVVREAVAAHKRQMVGCTEVSADHVVERSRQVWQILADGEGADWRWGRPGSGRNGRERRVVRPIDERPVADGGARRSVHSPPRTASTAAS
jgi:hypothetical protein